jgi:hypothetical protein
MPLAAFANIGLLTWKGGKRLCTNRDDGTYSEPLVCGAEQVAVPDLMPDLAFVLGNVVEEQPLPRLPKQLPPNQPAAYFARAGTYLIELGVA